MKSKSSTPTLQDKPESGQTVPPMMTDEQVREARKIAIENSRILLQEHEQEQHQLKERCFQEIAAVCAKYGLQMSCEVSKPEVTIHLISLP